MMYRVKHIGEGKYFRVHDEKPYGHGAYNITKDQATLFTLENAHKQVQFLANISWVPKMMIEPVGHSRRIV